MHGRRKPPPLGVQNLVKRAGVCCLQRPLIKVLIIRYKNYCNHFHDRAFPLSGTRTGLSHSKLRAYDEESWFKGLI